MACLASLLVPCPLLGKGQAEVKQGMIMVRDVAHEDPDLAVVDLPPVATPLALHPHRMRAALGEAAGIEGDDTIGCALPMNACMTRRSTSTRAAISSAFLRSR